MNNQTSQQFNALQKATTQYQNDAKMADHMRRREVDLMNRASEQNKRDEEQCRIVHGNLGEEIRKAKTLENERKRYKDGIENDRRENVTVTSELKGKETNSKEQKIQWIKEMDVINNEIDLHQTNDEHKKTSKLLDAENVTWIVETKLDVLVKNSNDNGGGVDNDEIQNTTTEWDGVVSLTKEELSGLASVEERREVTVNEMKLLEQTIHQLRTKLLSTHTNLGEMEVDDLEAKWEQNYEYNNSDAEDEEEIVVGDENNMDVANDNGGKGNMNNNKAAGVLKVGNHAEKTSAAAPVHMDLFYSQDNNMVVPDSNSAFNVGYGC